MHGEGKVKGADADADAGTGTGTGDDAGTGTGTGAGAGAGAGAGRAAGWGPSRPSATPIDWSAPWLVPYRDVGQRVHARWQAGASVAEALNAEAACPAPVRPASTGPAPTGPAPTCSAPSQRAPFRPPRAQPAPPWPRLAAGPLRFVPQAELPPATAYEAHIAQTACVPTRDNLHDFFNGLVWLHQPALKRRLNALQAAVLARHGVGARRGALRDRLTLFDENAACWAAPPTLADALRRRDWHALFIRHRADWDGAPPVLFGHALLEKLCRPRKPITAHVWLVPPGESAPAAWVLSELLPAPQPDPSPDPPLDPPLDPHPDPHPERAAPLCAGQATSPRPAAVPASASASAVPAAASAPAVAALPPRPWPLPVLGVPGWWPGNADPRFYDDPAVFRR